MTSFTGHEEIYIGFNRKLFFTDESTDVTPETEDAIQWIELGYDDAFSFDENENEMQKYNKRVKSHKKKGRKEYTFEVSQLYSGVQVSIFMFKQRAGTLKQVTTSDSGEIVEVNYFHNAYINSPQFSGGTDDGDDTVSASGDYSERYMYDGEGTGATLLYATDGSHEKDEGGTVEG